MTEMDLLSPLLDHSIHSTATRRVNKSQVKLANGMVISDLADHSPASALGLEAGDYLLLVDGEPACNIDFNLLGVEPERRTFEFYKTKSYEKLIVKFDGLPLGIKLGVSDETLVSNYNWYRGEPEDLVKLWQNHRDGAIKQLVQKWIRKKVLFWERKVPSVISRILLLDEREILFTGVGLYEDDQFDAGIHYVQRYLQQYSHRWTTEYTAIALYYMALEHIRRGDEETGIETMETAYEYCNLDRIGNRLGLLGGELIEDRATARLQGERFPIDYELKSLDGKKVESLGRRLSGLQAHQLMAVCSLGPYRSNAPYDTFMQRFIHLHRHFPRVFAGLHVITGGDHNKHWLRHEKLAIERDLPITVLTDPDQSVMAALESTTSPDLFFLDKDGIVVSTIDLENELDVWQLLWQRMNIKTVG